jgi:hypothetical protein
MFDVAPAEERLEPTKAKRFGLLYVSLSGFGLSEKEDVHRPLAGERTLKTSHGQRGRNRKHEEESGDQKPSERTRKYCLNLVGVRIVHLLDPRP